jgi:putative transposase
VIKEVIRSFKYRLHPNQHQEQILMSWFVQCCSLYNAALEQRVTAYKQHGRSITKYEQQLQLTELRAADPEWRVVPALVQRSALERLDRAFLGFFARCKAGEQAGFPRFRSARRYMSLSIHRGAWTEKSPVLQKGRLHIPKLGHVKLNLYRPLVGEVLQVSIWRDSAARWWTSIACDIGDAPAKVSVVNAVGMDLGLKTLVVLSNGESVENPRFGDQGAPTIARLNRALFRKRAATRSRECTRLLLAKAHAHVANQRVEYARKTAKDLCARYDLIAHEDPRGMLSKLHREQFSKSFHDVAWGLLLRCLTLKVEETGRWLVPVDPRATSQLCSGCGMRVEKKLSERVHYCAACGLEMDRDRNAAINILTRGLRVLELERSGVEGEVSSTVTSKGQGRAGVPRLGANRSNFAAKIRSKMKFKLPLNL